MVQAGSQERLFQLVGEHPALDLVNTLDWRFRDGGPEELLGGYGDLVDFAQQVQLVTVKQARQLKRRTTVHAGHRVLLLARDLREALADLLYSEWNRPDTPDASLKALEKHFQAARAQTRLVRDQAQLRWEWAADAEARAEYPLWLLTRAASRLLVSESVQKVRECGNPDCRWLFLDTSKNHTRRWCDMKICGNRMKARRFKAQHKPEV
ncbi:MAG: CGNR zinc finger domain-containing protein [Terracidiphilus sp.]